MLASASSAIIIGFNVRPEPAGARAGRAGGRRHPHLPGDLQGHRGRARRPHGHAQAGVRRAGHRLRRGAPDLQGVAPGHHRRLLRDQRQDHAYGRRPRPARRRRRLRRQDGVAQALPGGRARGRSRATSAASCSTASTTSRKATSSRPTRPGKSRVAAEAYIGLLLADLHFPENRSLKDKRAPLDLAA